MAVRPSNPRRGPRRGATLLRVSLFAIIVLLLLLALTPLADARGPRRDFDTWYDCVDVVGDWGYTGSSDGQIIRWPRDTGSVTVKTVTSQDIHGIDMVTSSIGYFVTYAGPGGRAKVFKTVNGGGTWKVKKTARLDLLACVRFRTARLGWVAGRYGAIFRTSDGGATWVKQRSGTRQTIYGLCFPTNAIGYAVGTAGTILKTTDGGKTWVKQKSQITQPLYGCDFVGSAVGFACGGDAAGAFVSTTNGGRTWKPLDLSLPPLAQVDFATKAEGYVIGNFGTWPNYTGVIYRVGEGGLTWTLQSSYDPAPPDYGLSCLKVMSMAEAYAEGQAEASLYTDDGITWHLAHIYGQ